jgi:hypothetical protein
MLLLVDEAQTLPTLLLEELRMMTNLARGGESRVRLVLAGSMELEELLAGPDLQAFAQRLAARCYLEAFDLAETIDYLRFQVAVAGGQAERVFDAGALDAVYRATQGIPRLVNQLCDHALVLAYQAERRPLDAKAIDIAWADLQQLPSPWQHEHAADGQAQGPRETIEFGTLDDDEPASPAHWQAGHPTHGPVGAGDMRSGEEHVEVDFSADWPADEPHEPFEPATSIPADSREHSASSPLVNPAAAKARARGLRIVEDFDQLQVVVDPYSLDDHEGDDEEPDDAYGADEPICDAVDDVVTGEDAAVQEAAAEQARPAVAHGDQGAGRAPHVCQDVVVPAEPRGWNSAPAQRASVTSTSVTSASATTRQVPLPSFPAAPSEAHRSLEEEIVADRYAELDARQPRRPATKPPVKNASAGNSPKSMPANSCQAKDFTALSDGEGDRDEPSLEERVTLAEAMRLRAEAEAAAAAARVIAQSAEEQLRLAIDNAPPLPSAEDWLADSAPLLLDPTQMPPNVVQGQTAPDLGSDIVVIEEQASPPPPAGAEPVHRVERRDYKSLFARLRRG